MVGRKCENKERSCDNKEILDGPSFHTKILSTECLLDMLTCHLRSFIHLKFYLRYFFQDVNKGLPICNFGLSITNRKATRYRCFSPEHLREALEIYTKALP